MCISFSVVFRLFISFRCWFFFGYFEKKVVTLFKRLSRFAYFSIFDAHIYVFAICLLIFSPCYFYVVAFFLSVVHSKYCIFTYVFEYKSILKYNENSSNSMWCEVNKACRKKRTTLLLYWSFNSFSGKLSLICLYWSHAFFFFRLRVFETYICVTLQSFHRKKSAGSWWWIKWVDLIKTRHEQVEKFSFSFSSLCAHCSRFTLNWVCHWRDIFNRH